MDRYWQAVADFLVVSGLKGRRTVAPREFDAGVAIDGDYVCPPLIADVDVVLLHKGRAAELPRDFLRDAFRELTPAFANEVFIVLARDADAIVADGTHAAGIDALVQSLLHEDFDASTPGLPLRLTGRMPATYVGGGRVLVETAFGHLMVLAGADTSITPHLVRDGWFDFGLTSAINRFLRPGMTYVDVGANMGTYALVAAAIVGDTGRVVAIEAVPRVASLLRETLAMNGFTDRSSVLVEAAAENSGTIPIFAFTTRQGGSTTRGFVADAASIAYGEIAERCDVPCRPLDDMLATTGISRLDLLKIDVEGSELSVLRGAQATIARFRPRLLVEWHPAFFEPGSGSVLHALLVAEMGYALRRVEPDGTSSPITYAELATASHVDILAVPSSE